MEKIDGEEIKTWFGQEAVVQHYADAAIDMGLWRSEEQVFTRVFKPEQTLLEVGCGAGRISFGLWELGYRRILATDLSRAMIARARRLAAKLDYAVPLRVADATQLGFEAGMFDGAIFGFNGIMQIPGRAARRQAWRELRRVVRPGGRLVFTTHDRRIGGSAEFWENEEAAWSAGRQDPRLHELGDRIVASGHGPIFIHIPTREEVVEDLAATGWTLLEDAMRSEIAEEPAAVEDFAVECRFWVAENPV